LKILLDTCTFLWVAIDAPELSPAARAAFRDPGNEVHLSAVSAWEIAVKHRLGRLPLPQTPARFVSERRLRYRLVALPLDEESALHAALLPDLHRDPFDRALVCQAIVHGMLLLTPDPLVAQYAVRTLW
jgi:PIN domain nuclease of toxin-antitoxin system